MGLYSKPESRDIRREIWKAFGFRGVIYPAGAALAAPLVLVLLNPERAADSAIEWKAGAIAAGILGLVWLFGAWHRGTLNAYRTLLQRADQRIGVLAEAPRRLEQERDELRKVIDETRHEYAIDWNLGTKPELERLKISLQRAGVRGTILRHDLETAQKRISELESQLLPPSSGLGPPGEPLA
jgi:hypothetical protein